MKIDPYYKKQKCRQISLVSGGLRFTRIFEEEGREGASNDNGVVENGNFQRSR